MSISTASVSSILLLCAASLAQPGCIERAPAEARPAPRQPDVAAEHEPQWQSGPRVDSRDELEAWVRELQQEPSGQHRRVRVPLVISFDEKRLAIASASIGTSPHISSGIEVALDDGALGIPLIERLRRRCGAGQTTCPVWVEGHWGPLVETGEAARRVAPPYPFAVFEVLERSPNGAMNVLQLAQSKNP